VYKCISYRNLCGIRTCRDVGTFSYFSESSQPALKIAIPLKIQAPSELTQEPVTLGDHLRRRRLELGLYQKDVAVKIGVTTSTIWNWEHGWAVDQRYLPRIITFLGYNPISCPVDLLEQLAWYKQVNGLTLLQLGEEMGRDPEQLADWLSGRHQPCRRNLKEIGLFLSDRLLQHGQPG
jgi:transcriptional regulator with XRE-family HTH domain